jgi:hypothetical protein
MTFLLRARNSTGFQGVTEHVKESVLHSQCSLLVILYVTFERNVTYSLLNVDSVPGIVPSCAYTLTSQFFQPYQLAVSVPS